MSIKSLITSFAIVASTSTVALAKPAVLFDANASLTVGPTYHRPVVRDHRADDCDTAPVQAPVQYKAAYWYRAPEPRPVVYSNSRINSNAAGTWSTYMGPIGSLSGHRGFGMIAISAPTRIENTTSHRQDFLLGADKGRFNTVQLRGVAGSSFITKVTIQFMNGEIQVVMPNRTLDARYPLSIDLNGSNRQITRILVYGTSSPGSAYQVLGA